jgi:hypothetical protein
MNISAPRVEAISSLDSSQEQYAGQPQEDGNNTWLARAYDRFIEKHGDDLEVIGIAGCAAVPVGLAFGVALVHGPFWAITITACSIGFYAMAMTGVVSLRDKIRDRDERIKEINDSALWRLCERRRELNEALMAENSHLEQDIMHWKVLCLTERGGLGAEDTAAGELSRSENKEASAAVFEFPDPKGAA